MKKILLVAAVISGISGLAYASSHAGKYMGANRFVENLDLDEVRAAEVQQILSSYMQIKDLAMNGEFDQIPVFIKDKETELAQVLTEAEMIQFKENVGQWAKDKDFSKYKKYAAMFANKDH